MINNKAIGLKRIAAEDWKILSAGDTGIKILTDLLNNNETKKQLTPDWKTAITYPLKLNSVALVCERSMPTERPPLVGEVSANF
jgi:hypothetical protein